MLVYVATGCLSDHQHVEDDHRRQADDHAPDAERPENVLCRETLVGGNPIRKVSVGKAFGRKASVMRDWNRNGLRRRALRHADLIILSMHNAPAFLGMGTVVFERL